MQTAAKQAAEARGVNPNQWKPVWTAAGKPSSSGPPGGTEVADEQRRQALFIARPRPKSPRAAGRSRQR